MHELARPSVARIGKLIERTLALRVICGQRPLAVLWLWINRAMKALGLSRLLPKGPHMTSIPRWLPIGAHVGRFSTQRVAVGTLLSCSYYTCSRKVAKL